MSYHEVKVNGVSLYYHEVKVNGVSLYYHEVKVNGVSLYYHFDSWSPEYPVIYFILVLNFVLFLFQDASIKH